MNDQIPSSSLEYLALTYGLDALLDHVAGCNTCSGKKLHTYRDASHIVLSPRRDSEVVSGIGAVGTGYELWLPHM